MLPFLVHAGEALLPGYGGQGIQRADAHGGDGPHDQEETSERKSGIRGTFEELAAMFDAKGIDPEKLEHEEEIHDATGAGRGYGVAGGVAEAIEKCINAYYPDVDVYIEHAEGLDECRKMLLLAKTGKKDGCLIEGMGCPGGCVAGAGTLQAVNKSTAMVNKYVSDADKKCSLETEHEITLGFNK